ncbi:hypothetical protein [uncultured Psychroserpens sp.]|uniref:hypothetical protein n=1 Tax=uncultured Psychroserpens sp. TaxID=255436 RepID=UPI002601CFDA|nr:hypothetical protein [uncultured Psychroserpens sp.]
MKSKVNAYTLNEMLITIIITSIVIGMAFTVLTLVQRHMWSIQENLKSTTQLNQLEQSLWIDINRYNKLSYSNAENKLLFKSDSDSMVYYLKPDFITRSTDTFHIEFVHKQFFFDGNEVSNGNIDAIRFGSSKKHRNQHLFIYKKNDATQFMN